MSTKPNRSDFWSNEKIINYFDKLIEHSIKPAVDWKKFRRLDAKNKRLFEDITNAHLAVFLLQRKRIRQGICIACGKNKIDKGNLCSECLLKICNRMKK